MIGRSGERGSGISAQATRHDDDDVRFQVFRSNTNNLHTVVWFQVFLSNPDDFQIVVWIQVF